MAQLAIADWNDNEWTDEEWMEMVGEFRKPDYVIQEWCTASGGYLKWRCWLCSRDCAGIRNDVEEPTLLDCWSDNHLTSDAHKDKVRNNCEVPIPDPPPWGTVVRLTQLAKARGKGGATDNDKGKASGKGGKGKASADLQGAHGKGGAKGPPAAPAIAAQQLGAPNGKGGKGNGGPPAAPTIAAQRRWEQPTRAATAKAAAKAAPPPMPQQQIDAILEEHHGHHRNIALFEYQIAELQKGLQTIMDRPLELMEKQIADLQNGLQMILDRPAPAFEEVKQTIKVLNQTVDDVKTVQVAGLPGLQQTITDLKKTIEDVRQIQQTLIGTSERLAAQEKDGRGPMYTPSRFSAPRSSREFGI